jgi:short-subunit dehydrogenase
MSVSRPCALITGASRGLGRVLVQELIQQGYEVWGLARDKNGLEQTSLSLGTRSSFFHMLPVDLASPEDLASIIPMILEKTPHLQLLIHNAGVEYYEQFENFSYGTLEKIHKVNILAPMELTRLLIPTLKNSKGHVVNIASLAGKKGVVYNAPYSASKGAMLIWADAMTQEFKGEIDFTTICPGYMDETGMYHDFKKGPVPFLLGVNSLNSFLKCFRRVLKKRPKEVILNKGPMRLLLAVSQLCPSLGDYVTHLLGLKAMNEKRIGLSRL